VTTVAVGAGNTFLAAMQKGAIDGGMTTEPTVSRALATNLAKILIDMRTIEGTREVLGGTYPAASLYMNEAWVNAHPDETQKLANAFVKTLHFIDTHSAEEITQKMPKDYYAGDRAAYVKALADGKAMFTPDGKMPADGPETVLKVLSYKKEIANTKIDLARTYTTKFVDAAAKAGM
jgi:NitT/TauT family transport system substrate-binding protein